MLQQLGPTEIASVKANSDDEALAAT